MTSPPTADNPETILVVEDDSAILRLVQSLLQGAGYKVLTASSVNAAVRAEASCAGPIDLLLSDIMMPDLAGPELAQVLKRQRPDMRVMLMSGYPNGAMLVLNHGWHFIEKPFLPAALLDKVSNCLHTTVRDQGADHFDSPA
jgi:DNA-binding NtrC family response regulator